MKKVLAIVALVAAMFVAGNVQAQSTIYAGYAAFLKALALPLAPNSV